MKLKKFATQIDETVLKKLRVYSATSGRNISYIVTEAVREYLEKDKLDPAFHQSMEEILKDHGELIKRLAKD